MIEHLQFWGIDLSLSSTGLVCLNEYSQVVLAKRVCSMNSESAGQFARIVNMRDSIFKILSGVIKGSSSKVFVAMEGVAYAARGNATYTIGMLTGLIRHDILYSLSSKVDKINVYSPMQVKKFVLGCGRTKSNEGESKADVRKRSKLDMIEAVSNRWKIETTSDDIADAVAVAKLLKADAGAFYGVAEELDESQCMMISNLKVSYITRN